MSTSRPVEKKGLASICGCFANLFKREPAPTPAIEALLQEYRKEGVEIEMNPLPKRLSA